MPVIIDLTEQEVYQAIVAFAADKAKLRHGWEASCSLLCSVDGEESEHRAVVSFDVD